MEINLFQIIRENEIPKLKKVIQILEDYNYSEINFISKSFTLEDIPVMKTWDNWVLYYFKIEENLTKEELEKFWKDFEKEGRKYVKRNISGKENQEILYVWSSHNFWKRFKEHCGLWYKGTYSLQLKHWINTNRQIRCYYTQINTESEDILQILEDAIYTELKPLFWKKWKK
jgi:hypothetical protein